MPIGLIGMLPVLAVAVWLTLRQMKQEEKNWTKGAVVHPSARRPLYYYINKKKPGKPARKNRKFGAKNWLLYTNAKKAQKTLKKSLPNPLECGTICERQALRQRMTSEASARSLWKEPIDVQKHQLTLRCWERSKFRTFKSLEKKNLTKNHFCGKIIKSSAARLRRTGPWKLNNIEKLVTEPIFVLEKHVKQFQTK